MTLKLFLTLVAVTLLGVGLTWAVAPGVLFTVLGVTPSDALLFMGRRYAAYPLGLAACLWLARDAAPSPARRAVLAGGLVAIGLTTVTSLAGAATGTFGPMAWGIGGTEVLMTAGFAWFLFGPKQHD